MKTVLFLSVLVLCVWLIQGKALESAHKATDIDDVIHRAERGAAGIEEDLRRKRKRKKNINLAEALDKVKRSADDRQAALARNPVSTSE